ncbi:hypothetical protein P7K49_000174 [Saguinus oedipus]|uniref:Uncharacterized protein n=1 Tax=Saguinus oedipus TaxID=9490 RepID=A0ABQ9WAY6_SAGOE|nr:hypothetical protein P7K49_000174 [Saguinus oedipus]
MLESIDEDKGKVSGQSLHVSSALHSLPIAAQVIADGTPTASPPALLRVHITHGLLIHYARGCSSSMHRSMENGVIQKLWGKDRHTGKGDSIHCLSATVGGEDKESRAWTMGPGPGREQDVGGQGDGGTSIWERQ